MEVCVVFRGAPTTRGDPPAAAAAVQLCARPRDHSTRSHRTLHAGGGKHEGHREEEHALCNGRAGAAGTLDRSHLAQGFLRDCRGSRWRCRRRRRDSPRTKGGRRRGRNGGGGGRRGAGHPGGDRPGADGRRLREDYAGVDGGHDRRLVRRILRAVVWTLPKAGRHVDRACGEAWGRSERGQGGCDGEQGVGEAVRRQGLPDAFVLLAWEPPQVRWPSQARFLHRICQGRVQEDGLCACARSPFPGWWLEGTPDQRAQGSRRGKGRKNAVSDDDHGAGWVSSASPGALRHHHAFQAPASGPVEKS